MSNCPWTSFLLLVIGVSCEWNHTLGQTQIDSPAARQSPSCSAQRVETGPFVTELFVVAIPSSRKTRFGFWNTFNSRDRGLRVNSYDMLTNKAQWKRLWELLKQFGYEKREIRTLCVCSSLKIGFRDAAGAYNSRTPFSSLRHRRANP